MVVCYSCGATVSGSWCINQSGYNNGTYTGIKAYFAYSGVDWIYVYCTTCFSNGTFSKALRSFYAGPINTIIQEQIVKNNSIHSQNLNNKQKQIQTLKSNLTVTQLKFKQLTQNFKVADLRIKQLQQKQKLNQKSIQQLTKKISQQQITIELLQKDLQKYDIVGKILNQQSKELILKLQQKYKQIQKCLKIPSQQFISHLSCQINLLIKNYSDDKKQSLKNKLNLIKQKCQQDIQKLKKIQISTLNQLKALKSTQIQNSMLFEDQQIQNCQQMFQNKRKIKQDRLKQIIKHIESNN